MSRCCNWHSICFAILLTAQVTIRADETATKDGTKTPNDSVVTTTVATVQPKEKSVQELAAIAKKSVVVVTFTGRDGQRQGLGTGFILSEDGLIATNLHVIGEARPIRVELHDGRKFDVTAVHATERAQDLAVLRIDARDLPVLPLGNSDELQEGQAVVAIGNPLGLERSVVSGVLSGRREIEGRSMLQVALPIEQGNSGGPLLDMQGRVHGLLTLKSLKTENLGFAITVNSLKPLLEKPNPIPMNRWLTIGAMDPEEWTVLPGGRWRQRAGQIAVDGRGGGFGGRALCLATESTPAIPFEVAVQVKFTPGDGAAGLVFHSDGGDKHYGFYPSNGGVRLTRFDGPDFNSWAVLREIRTPALKKESWNSLRIRIEPERIICYLNGEMMMETKDVTYTSGKVGLCKFRQTDAEFKGFRIGKTLSEPVPTDELASRVSSTVDRLSADEVAVNRAAESLAAEDANVIDLLERHARSLEGRAAQVRRLASDIHMVKTLSEFEKVIKNEPINLLRGALLIARLDNSELDIEGYVQEVERHARRVKGSVARDASEDDLFIALNRYLFEEQGFHGSRTDSGNRSNSYVNEVLDDREGLPITLTVVYLEIARRLGLNVVGVGMPGHFLARHEPKLGSPQLVDVFDRGRQIRPADAKAKFEDLSEAPWKESYLDAISHTATLIRILRNLFVAANEARELDRMLRYTDAILILSPDSVQDHMFRARLCYETERWQQARNEIDWLSKHDSEIYRDQIEILARAIARDSQK